MIKKIVIICSVILLCACGTLDDKTVAINAGDSKEKVMSIMGTPQDRQLKGDQEAWQYCVSGAGFGYNDHKVIWFKNSLVTGITSYRSSRSGCVGAIKTIVWSESPDFILETRER